MAAIGQTVKTGRPKKYPTQKKLNGSTTHLKNLNKYLNQASIGSIMEATKKYLKTGEYFFGRTISGKRYKLLIIMKLIRTFLMK